MGSLSSQLSEVWFSLCPTWLWGACSPSRYHFDRRSSPRQCGQTVGDIDKDQLFD